MYGFSLFGMSTSDSINAIITARAFAADYSSTNAKNIPLYYIPVTIFFIEHTYTTVVIASYTSSCGPLGIITRAIYKRCYELRCARTWSEKCIFVFIATYYIFFFN
jgi:hypothetical protein